MYLSQASETGLEKDLRENKNIRIIETLKLRNRNISMKKMVLASRSGQKIIMMNTVMKNNNNFNHIENH